MPDISAVPARMPNRPEKRVKPESVERPKEAGDLRDAADEGLTPVSPSPSHWRPTLSVNSRRVGERRTHSLGCGKQYSLAGGQHQAAQDKQRVPGDMLSHATICSIDPDLHTVKDNDKRSRKTGNNTSYNLLVGNA